MIIIINGTSSSGKSTVCQELHHKLGDGWVNFSMDGYLSMLGNKFLELHPDNQKVCEPNDICYAKKHTDGTYEIISGKLCSQLYETIPAVIEIIAKQSFNILVDSFITTWDEFKPYKERLEQYGMLFVYLYASENVINAREEARGDRLKGSAVHWLKAFECQDACDLTINTNEIGVEEISEIILQKKQTQFCHLKK